MDHMLAAVARNVNLLRARENKQTILITSPPRRQVLAFFIKRSVNFLPELFFHIFVPFSYIFLYKCFHLSLPRFGFFALLIIFHIKPTATLLFRTVRKMLCTTPKHLSNCRD